MSDRQTPLAPSAGGIWEEVPPVGGSTSGDWFDQAMRAPGATLDNAVDPDRIGSHGLQPDGDDR